VSASADVAIGPNLMFATRLGGKFKEFPGLAKYVAMLKVSPAQRLCTSTVLCLQGP